MLVKEAPENIYRNSSWKQQWEEVSGWVGRWVSRRMQVFFLWILSIIVCCVRRNLSTLGPVGIAVVLSVIIMAMCGC